MSFGQHTAVPNTEHLTVQGEAELHLPPGTVEVSATVSRVEETAAQAKANVDARSAAIITLARELGIANDDIRATELTVAPHREYRNHEYVHQGYEASRQVELTLRDLKNFNALLAQVVEVPVDRITGLDTKLSDEAGARQQALARAVEDAKAKARVLAQQFEVKLGPVFSIHALPKEERFYIGGAAARASTEDASFSPGMIKVEARVNVTFYLEKAGPR